MTSTALETLLREIAPEVPVYVLETGDLATPQPVGPETLAITGPLLDIALQRDLEHLGRWHGRRPGMLLSSKNIRAEVVARWGADPEARRQERLLTVAMAIHELAHILQRPAPYYSEWRFGPELLTAVTWLAIGKSREERGPDPRPTLPGGEHGGRFRRIALHLGARAERATGLRIPAAVLCPSEDGLRHPAAYAAALQDEIETLRSVPIETILSVSPGASFQKLWASDVTDWFSSEKGTDEMLSNLLEKIGQLHTSRRRQRATAYGELVRGLTEGERCDPAAAAQVLDDTGKTAADLATDVALYTRRKQLRATIDKLPELDREAASLNEKIRVAGAELDAAEVRHREAVLPLQWRAEEIAAAKSAAAQARQELRTTAPAELENELQKIDRELRAIGPQITRLSSDEADARSIGKSNLDDWSGRRSERRKWIDGKRREADSLAGKLAELCERSAALVARQAKIMELQTAVWPAGEPVGEHVAEPEGEGPQPATDPTDLPY